MKTLRGCIFLTVENGFKNWLLVISCQFLLLSCNPYKYVSQNKYNVPECTHSIIIDEPVDLVRLILSESGFTLYPIDSGFRTENRIFDDIKVKYEFTVKENQVITNIYWRPILKTKNYGIGYQKQMYQSDLEWRQYIYSDRYDCKPYLYLISILKSNQIKFLYE